MPKDATSQRIQKHLIPTRSAVLSGASVEARPDLIYSGQKVTAMCLREACKVVRFEHL